MLFKFYKVWIFPLCIILLITSCTTNSQSEFNMEQAAKARVELGLAYLNQQQFAQAKSNFDKALAYSPNYYFVYSALAYFYQQQGQIEQAKQAYRKSLSLDNKQGNVHNNYAAFLCSQREFQTAYQQFELALSSPHYYQHADTYENLVICALSEGNAKLAEQYLVQLRKLDPARANNFNKHR